MAGMEKYIVKPQRIGQLVHHDIAKMEREAGSLWRFMENTMVPDADATVLVRKVEHELDETSQVGPEPHVHSVSQFYCLLDEIKLEVTLGQEKHMVKGPATIMVPAGTKHAIRFVGGTGYLVNILLQGSYE